LPVIRPYLWSNYEPNPDTTYTNKYGWRYGGGPVKKALRILCIGGSTTWSHGASSPLNSWPAQMESFLRQKGFSVDVINGGCSSYSTAEMIGSLAFKGIYTTPDIILIHEGINDIFPLLTPGEYKPDYSHWRTVNDQTYVHKLAILGLCWEIPSYAVRLAVWKSLKLDPFQLQTLGKETYDVEEALAANNDLTGRINKGYRMNLISLAALSKAHDAKPVFITVNIARDISYLLPWRQTYHKLTHHEKDRLYWGINHNNNIMLFLGREMSVPVIPFHNWSPSHNSSWIDFCHLDDQGYKEKAEFIGSWLINHGYLKQAREH
jgi:lysophospholipase L1-like esterase